MRKYNKMSEMVYIILLLVGLGAYFKYKSIVNPFTTFNALWYIIFQLIEIGSNYVYSPREEALKCVYYGVISYNLAFFIPSNIRLKKLILISDVYKPRYDLALKFSWVALIIGVLSAIRPLQVYISNGSIVNLRSNYFTYNNALDYLLVYARQFTISACRDVIMIISLLGYTNKYKRAKMLFINALLIVVLESLISGGRYVLFNTGVILVCFYFFYSSKIKFSFGQKMIIAISGIVLLYLIIFLTSRRVSYIYLGLSPLKLLKEASYEYFVGSVTYLGQLIYINSRKMGTTYGLNFFHGFIQPFFIVFGFLGMKAPDIINKMGVLTNTPLHIGDTAQFNALPTIFGYYYVDGKLIMVVIESFLFGYLCKKVFLRAKKNNNAFYVAAYLILSTQILNSSTRWFFYQADYCLSFLYLYLFFKRGKENVEEKVTDGILKNCK